jgi:delta 1-pyrroline-5-carboxylate dehydrogenase
MVAVLVLVLAGCTSATRVLSARSTDGLTFWLEVGSCNADLEVDVDETPEQVVIDVSAHNDANDACSDAYMITLSEPLGDRPLIDASDGAAIEVRSAEP